MIEFAPNPSGAAHIGTLRTYACAWLLARERSERLFMRFDAHNLVACGPRNITWAQSFLDELRELDLSPDGWEYLDQPGYARALPEWAQVRTIPWGHDQNGVPMADGPLTDVAYYPGPAELLRLPASEPRLYAAGQPDPICCESCPCWYYFAVRNGNGWGIDESLVSLQQMHFRGTSVIVRSSLSVFLYHYLELPAGKYFGYSVPATEQVDVVCDEAGALSKHRQLPGSPGTVRYSLNRIGAQALRDRVLVSANQPFRGMALHWREVVGD